MAIFAKLICLLTVISKLSLAVPTIVKGHQSCYADLGNPYLMFGDFTSYFAVDYASEDLIGYNSTGNCRHNGLCLNLDRGPPSFWQA